ncbi:DEAD/DEAH box helicase [bacterium]|nr:DEAD/DEAH box helicase [bacterium]
MIINIANKIHIPEVADYLMPILAKELTHPNPLYLEAQASGRRLYGISPVITNFEVDKKGGFHIPRGYLHRLCNITDELGIHLEVTDNRAIVPFTSTYGHIINLRDYQRRAIVGLSTYTDGLLVAPAGSGKTIIGISMILACNQKCLWITHTKQLLNQFVDRVQQFLSVTADDIGLIQNGVWDVDKPITAALVQTLIRDIGTLETLANHFGTVIIDECHHSPSTTFTKIVNTLNPFYLYGLTATPDRRDGLEQIMFQNIGPVRHIIERVAVADKIITPIIIPKYINSAIPESVEYGKLLTILTNDEDRNRIIRDDVLKEARAGNICIVATERVAHVEILYDLIKPYWDNTVAVVGKHSDKVRDIALNALNSGEATVLICTSHLLGEGFDHAPLNRLFMCLPFRNIVRCEQLVGRVQRISPGKHDAIIIDYVDNHGLTKHQFHNFGGKPCRRAVYEHLNCIIR